MGCEENRTNEENFPWDKRMDSHDTTFILAFSFITFLSLICLPMFLSFFFPSLISSFILSSPILAYLCNHDWSNSCIYLSIRQVVGGKHFIVWFCPVFSRLFFSDSIVIKLFIVDETLHFYPLSLDTQRCFTLQIWNFTGELNKPDILIMEESIDSVFLLFFKNIRFRKYIMT